MNKNILILGDTSFVATGLSQLLKHNGLNVSSFSRGSNQRNGDRINGDVFDLKNNPFIDDMDVVINFIYLKDKGVEDNIKYIKSVIDCCIHKNVKHLIHFSTIMAYDNMEPLINEKTDIERNTQKEGYGAVKIEVDKYLMNQVNLPFTITFVRPGYVLADDRPCPFIKKMPFGFSIIKGDSKSVQPIIKREDIHSALYKMIVNNSFDLVYLFTPNNSITKHQYAKQKEGGIILELPRWLILGTANIFLRLKLIRPALYVRIEGMYIRSIYDSTFTQSRLNIKF